MKINKEGNIVLYQHLLNQFILLFLLFLTLALAIWGTREFPWSIQPLDLGMIGSKRIIIPLPIFILPLLVIQTLYIHHTYNIRLVFCPEYLIHINGILDWKEKTVRVDYSNIREIEIDQTIYQKLFNLGDLVILIVSTQIESSLRMPGVKIPRKIKDFIRQRMEDSKNTPSLPKPSPSHNVQGP